MNINLLVTILLQISYVRLHAHVLPDVVRGWSGMNAPGIMTASHIYVPLDLLLSSPFRGHVIGGDTGEAAPTRDTAVLCSDHSQTAGEHTGHLVTVPREILLDIQHVLH